MSAPAQRGGFYRRCRICGDWQPADEFIDGDIVTRGHLNDVYCQSCAQSTCMDCRAEKAAPASNLCSGCLTRRGVAHLMALLGSGVRVDVLEAYDAGEETPLIRGESTDPELAALAAYENRRAREAEASAHGDPGEVDTGGERHADEPADERYDAEDYEDYEDWGLDEDDEQEDGEQEDERDEESGGYCHRAGILTSIGVDGGELKLTLARPWMRCADAETELAWERRDLAVDDIRSIELCLELPDDFCQVGELADWVRLLDWLELEAQAQRIAQAEEDQRIAQGQCELADDSDLPFPLPEDIAARFAALDVEPLDGHISRRVDRGSGDEQAGPGR